MNENIKENSLNNFFLLDGWNLKLIEKDLIFILRYSDDIVVLDHSLIDSLQSPIETPASNCVFPKIFP